MKTESVGNRSPGRPPSPIPRRKFGLTLSQGEINELQFWQERFSQMMGRKVSTGETVGILTRICTARAVRLEAKQEDESLEDFVLRMVGES